MKSLNINGHRFWLSRISDQAIELVCQDNKVNPAIYAQIIQKAKIKGIENIISTSTAMMIFAKRPEKVLSCLDKIKWNKPKVMNWKLPVYFDGFEDWESVEAKTKLSKAAYIDSLKKSNLSVAMFGFIPGFVYLDELPKSLRMKRKATPVQNNELNVFAVGGPYAGIYSLPSPSGWWVIGKIPLNLLTLEGEQPIDFNVGDQLKIVALDKSEFDALSKQEFTLRKYNE